MTTYSFSPAHLGYTASLRAIPPLCPTDPFTYAQWGCSDADAFLGLAASNPEGSFIALVTGQDIAALTKEATNRHVNNVRFTSSVLDLHDLDYLVADETKIQETTFTLDTFAAIASDAVKAGGLVAYRYKTYPNPDESLRFIVSQFAPEMNADQAKEFLGELNLLGSRYFAQHPIAKTALDHAIAQSDPDQFFKTCETKDINLSSSFNTIVAFTPRGFMFVGDTSIENNYLELAIPQEAQELLISCQENPLYESIKDFSTQNETRCDVWCRTPVEQSSDFPRLYNGFTFGVLKAREEIPAEVSFSGTTIDLTSSPYKELLDLMVTMPICIGDFLHHPTGSSATPSDVISAIHVLVATGIATPMRSSYEGQSEAVAMHPRLATGFNNSLNEMTVERTEINFASPVLGEVLKLSARDALVLQAINRAGIKGSVDALMPELQRAARLPALSAQIGYSNPTAEDAETIIKDVVNKSFVQWYTYGLLAA